MHLRLPVLLLAAAALTACSSGEAASPSSPAAAAASPSPTPLLPAGPPVTLEATQQGDSQTWAFTATIPTDGAVPVLYVLQFADGKVARSKADDCPATTGTVEVEHTYAEPVFAPALLTVTFAPACGQPVTLQSTAQAEVGVES